MNHVPLFGSRRDFLRDAGLGFGALAFAAMEANAKPQAAHFAAKADRVLFLFMEGGPSHVDLFDPKPELTKRHGEDYKGDVDYSFFERASKKLFASPWKFQK